MKSLVLFSCVLATVLAHEKYMDLIPNGHKVPDPCHPGDTFGASGHTDKSGKHGLNKFGEDFKKKGHKHWNRELCQMDSDGDGVTNGAELGDPDCTWTPGKSIGAPKSDPGICEPVGDSSCHHNPCH